MKVQQHRREGTFRFAGESGGDRREEQHGYSLYINTSGPTRTRRYCSPANRPLACVRSPSALDGVLVGPASMRGHPPLTRAVQFGLSLRLSVHYGVERCSTRRTGQKETSPRNWGGVRYSQVRRTGSPSRGELRAENRYSRVELGIRIASPPPLVELRHCAA